MGLLHKRKEGVPKTKSVGALISIRFFLALGNAVIMTVWALYLNSFVKSTSTTGYISSLLTLISFFSYFAFVPLVEKYDKGKLFSVTLFLTAISHLFFAFVTRSLATVVLISIATIIIQSIRITVNGIIIKDTQPKKSISKSLGLMYTFANIAFLIGPLLAGYLSSENGYSLVFIAGSLFFFAAYFIYKISAIKDKRISKKIDSNIIKNFIDYFRDKNRVIAYLVGGGVQLWWTFIFLFIPLFMKDNNLPTKYIGYFIFATSVPLIMTEYYISRKTSKIGFKKIFVTGYLITAILCLLCFFISNIYLILIILSIASFGLAFLEPTTESYFLQILNKKETTKYYGPYNTNSNTTILVGKLIASSVLLVLDFKYLFILFAVYMVFFFLISFKTKEV